MSDSSRLPARASLEQLRKQAKELLRSGRSDIATLADAQHAIARDYGFDTWAGLKHHIEEARPTGIELFERLAETLAAAYSTGDAAAIRQLNWSNGTSFVWEHDVLEMQRKLTRWFASEARTDELALADAQDMVAHAYGFENWQAFTLSLRQPPADPRSAPVFISTRPPFYKIDWQEHRLITGGPLSRENWDEICEVIEEHGIARVQAGGITDFAMQRLAQVSGITDLDVGGSAVLTDDGAAHLARMTQLQFLTLGGPQSPLTDQGLAALANLSALRMFQACWTPGISDKGLSHLSSCDQLEEANLLGTPAGDGSIRALTGKRKLRNLRMGVRVTDAGLRLLHEFPVFKTWQGGKIKYGLMSPDSEPNFVLLDGPFTDAGLASLAGLDGLYGLSFFWHCPNFTSAGLAPLKDLPKLGFIGCQDQHCDNQAMRHIAAIPGLRMLMGQGAVADDDGFEALSRSSTIEYIWGRECPNLGGRGFRALSSMPALRGLAVSCAKVDDDSLATLPRFPSLRELVPMGVPDAGFRHVGRCQNLESLWCMYCRDTGDAATGHIAGLKHLKLYYAGQTRITDRSLEILGRMSSLERIELWNCGGVSDAGIAHLVALPVLRELQLSNLSRVTRRAMTLFPSRVRVNYGG